jgi:predicted transposase YdaD
MRSPIHDRTNCVNLAIDARLGSRWRGIILRRVPRNLHNPFDVVMKRIVEDDPIGLLHFAGLSGGYAEPFDAELATISPQADYILRVHEPDYLAHFEFLSAYKADIGRRMLLYAALAHYNHELPVESVLILLRNEADGRFASGAVEYGSNTHRYRVIRLWELQLATILNGPPALLPLAPLTKFESNQLPEVVHQLDGLIRRETAPGDLWAKTMLLMGLKFDVDSTRKLLEGVMSKMQESVTYQAILDEGRAEGKVEGKAEGKAEGERQILLRTGSRRFGSPTPEVISAIEAFTREEDLLRLADRLFEVESWEGLLR